MLKVIKILEKVFLLVVRISYKRVFPAYWTTMAKIILPMCTPVLRHSKTYSCYVNTQEDFLCFYKQFLLSWLLISFFLEIVKLIQISNVWVFDPVHLVSYGFYWSNCPCILAHQARKIAGYQLQELQVKNRVYYLKWADRDLWDCCSLEQGQGRWYSMIVHDPVHPTFHHIPLPTDTTHKAKQKLN